MRSIANLWYQIHRCRVLYNEFSRGVIVTPLDNKRYKKYLGKTRVTVFYTSCGGAHELHDAPDFGLILYLTTTHNRIVSFDSLFQIGYDENDLAHKYAE